MSVTETVFLRRFPYRNLEVIDHGLPVGIWYAHPQVTGDASGGTVTILILFQPFAGPTNGQFYSLEQLSARINSEAANRAMSVRSVNFGTGLGSGQPGQLNIEHAAFMDVTAVVASGLALSDPRHLRAFNRVFLGRPVQGAAAQFNIAMTNIGAGVSLDVTAMGYVWNPGAINSPTGIRRPVESLW